MFSRDDVDELLGEKVKKFSHEIEFKNFGPGELDTNKLLRKRLNAFLHTTPSEAALTKKKLIFCFPPALFLDPVPELVQTALFAALTEYRDTCFWPGSGVSLHSAKPITSSEEFWDNLNTAVGATTEMVKDGLAEQGIAADNYIIFDYTYYCKILAACARLIAPRADLTTQEKNQPQIASKELNLSFTTANNYRHIAKLIKISSIQTVKMMPLHAAEIQELLSLFPYTENFTIQGATRGWVQSHLHLFKGKRVCIENLYCTNNEFMLPPNADLAALTLKFSHNMLWKLSFAAGAKVSELTLQGATHLKFDATHAQSVTHIFYIGCYDLRIDNFPTDNNIETFSIYDCDLLNRFDLTQLPKLKHFSMTGSSCKNFIDLEEKPTFYDSIGLGKCIDTHSVPLLETIELEDWLGCEHETRPKVLDLRKFLYLEKVSLAGFDENNILLPEHLTKFTPILPRTHTDRNVNTWDINATRVNNTSLIHFSSKSRQTKLDEYIPHLQKVKFLSVEGKATDLHALDFKNSERQIRELILIFDPEKTDRNVELFTFDLSYFRHLKKVHLRYLGGRTGNINLILTGCTALNTLCIDVDTLTVDVKGLETCHDLRSIFVRSLNASLLTRTTLLDLPPDCYKAVEATERVIPEERPEFWLDKWCNSLGSRQADCPDEATWPLPALFNFSGALCMFLIILFPDNPYSPPNNTDAPTLPPNTTQPATTLPSSPGRPISLYIFIAIGVASIAALFYILFKLRNYIKYRLESTGPCVNTQTNLDKKNELQSSIYTGRTESLEYRENLLNKVNESVFGLTFVSTKPVLHGIKVNIINLDDDNKVTIRGVMDLVDQSSDEALGFVEGTVAAKQLYPLPTIEAPLDKDSIINIYADATRNIKIFWDKNPYKPQYYFMIDEPQSLFSSKVKLRFFYHFKRNRGLRNKHELFDENSAHTIAVMDNKELLPKGVIDKMLAELNALSLQFLFNSQESIHSRLKSYIEYCRGLQHDKPAKSTFDPMECLLNVINDRAGSLQQCAEASLLMANFMGIPVTMSGSFCEIPVRGADDTIWFQRFELALSPILENNIFKELDKDRNKSCQSELQTIVTSNDYAEEMKAFEFYLDKFEERVAPGELNSLDAILFPEVTVPGALIELQAGQDALDINYCILRHLRTNELTSQIKHIYIHAYPDISLYFKPPRIENGEQIYIDGPLKAMLTNQNDLSVVVINLDNISPTDAASIQSVLDIPNPYLSIEGETCSITLNTKFIFLSRHPEQYSKPFTSRCKSWLLTEKFLNAINFYDDVENVEEAKLAAPQIRLDDNGEEIQIERIDRRPVGAVQQENTARLENIMVDLYHRPVWHHILICDIYFKGINTHLEEGPLLKAIKNGTHITVYNPPQDDDFRVLLHELHEHRQIFHNGEFLTVHPNFKLEVKTRENELRLPNVAVRAELPLVPESRKKIHIDIQRLHECMREVIFNPDGSATTLPGGLLEKYNIETEVFYIIGAIPKSYWQALLGFIKEYYPRKKFHFELAPNAAIEEVLNGVTEHKSFSVNVDAILNSQHKVIVSNDDRYLARELENKLIANGETPLVVNVNLQTTYNQLIATVLRDKTGFGFHYHERGVLERLLNKRTIIINGNMTLSLYYYLSTFLVDKPFAYVNGISHEHLGKVFIILPQENRLASEISAHCHYSFEDFEIPLAVKDTKNLDFLPSIKQFHYWLCRLPHRGSGRPSKPILTYDKLLTLLHELKKPSHIHANNPIKGFYNYDYPEGSADQAYINMLGKYFFAPGDTSPPRIEKINRLMSQHHFASPEEMKEHLWSLLNCFNGADLRHILGNDLQHSIQTSSNAFPVLTQIATNRLWEHYQTIANLVAPMPIRSRQEKQKLQLTELVKDPEKPVITLKGMPGISKTYTANKLLGAPVKDVNRWFYSGGHYVADEYNTKPKGHFDPILTAFTRESHRGFKDDHEFVLQKLKHKFLTTGNPENFPGRHHDPVMQDISETLWFKTPDDAFLTNLLKDILDPRTHIYIEPMIKAFHLIGKFNPFFATSLRVILNLARRFICLTKEIQLANSVEMKAAVLDACIGEFAGAVRHQKERNQFINELTLQICGQHAPIEEADTLIYITPTIGFPMAKRYVIESAWQDLLIRLEMLIEIEKKKEQHHLLPEEFDIYYKQTILIEGGSGIGKSTFYRALMEKYHLLLTNRLQKLEENLLLDEETVIQIKVIKAELTKKVYEISISNFDPVQLKQAIDDQAIIIVDESNLCLQIEELIDSIPPGVMICASQNGSDEIGRKDESGAKRDRVHRLYMDNFSRHELKLYAIDAKIPHPEQFVRAYMQTCETFPRTNMRIFHQVLANIDKRVEHNRLRDCLPTPISDMWKVAAPKLSNPSNLAEGQRLKMQ